MRHYDLDHIADFRRFTDTLHQKLTAQAFTELPGDGEVEVRDVETEPAERGWQITRRRKLQHRRIIDGSGIQITAIVTRFLNPTGPAINNTLELYVRPLSRKVVKARLLLLIGLPILGLLIGLLFWRMLQYDTGMTSPPWAVTGIIIGELIALALMPFWSHPLGALMEGKNAPGSLARLRAVRNRAEQITDETVAEFEKVSTETTNAGSPPADDPAALAAFTDALIDDPDRAIAAFRLNTPAGRQNVANVFRRLKNDPERLNTYKKARQESPQKANPAENNS